MKVTVVHFEQSHTHFKISKIILLYKIRNDGMYFRII